MISRLKGMLFRLIQRMGYDVHRRRAPSVAVPINVFRLVVQDVMARRRAAGDGGRFFVVQIGAHDGMHYDPIRPFILEYGWGGILVEPQPAIFRRLAENYRGQPQIALENVAIGYADGTTSMYAFRPSPDLPDHATMLTSFRRSALELNTHGYRFPIDEITVPVLSVRSLLAKHQVRRVDLLQIDTEGFDYEIIKMLRDTAVRPEVIHFESGGLGPQELIECLDLLAGWGYRVLTIGIDTIAYRQPGDEDFAETQRNEGYDTGPAEAAR